jgi:hypothetical protein
MRNNKIFFVFICLISFASICFGYQENLNSEQPISIGEKIYTVSDRIGDVAKGIVYIYEGCDNNSIKIKIRKDAVSVQSGPLPAIFETLTLPLNDKKQALLKVETLNQSEPKKEMLITVADNFSRIKVDLPPNKWTQRRVGISINTCS